jgi:NhaA family Na+:H+ antiporter
MSAPRASRASLSPLRFISVEAASGIVLLIAATVALAWANSPWAYTYEALWRLELGFGLARWLPAHDLHFWVNDGLMTVFFLIVGLEIRREMHDGALADPGVAALPLIAALGGVVVPAIVYLLINSHPVMRRGWAIPTATDIAFAVGVLSLIPRVPPALRVLLLTLAIVDDIAAVLIIALFYSSGIAASGLLEIAAGVLLVLAMQWLGVRAALAYTAPGAIVWFGMLHAGVHPTLTGVLLGLLTPATVVFGRSRGRSPVERGATEAPVVRVAAVLHPWVAFGIMPLFALANAGVSLAGLGGGAHLRVGLGIVLGLVLGKPAGILLASYAAVTSKLCVLPEGVQWRQVLLLGVLGGIGFTMAIFIANLAFEDPVRLVAAKFAVLVASGLAATLGLILGRLQPAAEVLRVRA